MLLLLLWLEHYLVIRLLDLTLALWDRMLVNVVQYWWRLVVAHLRAVRNVHRFNVRLTISIGRRRKSAIAREDLRHIQARDFWGRTADVARSRAAEPTDVGDLI